MPQLVTVRSPKRKLAYFNIPVCLFAQPKEGSCQNLQAIPVAELAKSFGTSQLRSPKALAAFVQAYLRVVALAVLMADFGIRHYHNLRLYLSDSWVQYDGNHLP